MKNYSIWFDGVDNGNYPKLSRDLEVDVLIIGGGITGLSTAYHLKDSNLRVALVERNKLASGVSARTTGKLTYLQGDIYTKISNMYNKNVASLYYESQKDAIKIVNKIVKDNNIDCNFTKQKSYLFAKNDTEIGKLLREKKLLDDIGVKVSMKKINLGNSNYYSLLVNDTYYFHPVKYLKNIAKICIKNNVSIYENTNVTKILKNDNFFYCFANNYKIKAKKVVIASHYPYFLKPFIFPLKGSVEKSYIGALKTSLGSNASGISVPKSNISFRYFSDSIVNNYFLYLNGSHNLAFNLNYKERFNNLENDIKMLGKKAKYIWSNTDIITNDYLPYIGLIYDNFYIATGYNTWGMTNGSLAGAILSDIILNKYNKYISLFSPKRVMPFMGNLNIIKDIFSSFKPFIEARINKNKSYYGNNVVFKKINGKNIAIYTDKNNKEHIVYSTCPHLKCSLIFNEVERTWDCPCHASKFTIDGKCIMGPSKKDITYKD